MAQFREIDEEEWNKMPVPKALRPPNPWDELLGAVESGRIVVLEVPEGKLRGTRIGLARSASSRGMKLEFRAEGTRLAIRRSSKPLQPRAEGQAGPRTTRRRKGETRGGSGDSGGAGGAGDSGEVRERERGRE